MKEQAEIAFRKMLFKHMKDMYKMNLMDDLLPERIEIMIGDIREIINQYYI